MPQTPSNRLKIVLPNPVGEAPDVVSDMERFRDNLEASAGVMLKGTAAEMASFDATGLVAGGGRAQWRQTDTGDVYYHNGTGWVFDHTENTWGDFNIPPGAYDTLVNRVSNWLDMPQLATAGDSHGVVKFTTPTYSDGRKILPSKPGRYRFDLTFDLQSGTAKVYPSPESGSFLNYPNEYLDVNRNRCIMSFEGDLPTGVGLAVAAESGYTSGSGSVRCIYASVRRLGPIGA